MTNDRDLSRGGPLDNPLLALGLGVCPALAVTTTATAGLGMGVATACVLILTSLMMGLVGKFLTESGRFAVALILSAGLATVAQMVLMGWFPSLYEALGIYAPLIAVSSLVLCRAGGYAASHGAVAGLADGAVMGLGYVCAMAVVGAIRELLGRGTLFGAVVLPASYEPLLLAVMPAGGLMLVGILMGLWRAAKGRGGREGT